MTRFIAEISSNHNNSLDRAMRFVDMAKFIGCSGVKFTQLKRDQLFADGFGPKDLPEMPEKWHKKLAHNAHQLGLEYGVTPCYLDAVDAVAEYVDFFKIASYDVLWLDLLERVGAAMKPVIASAGMTSLEERSAANEALRHSGCPKVEWLYCVSAYPAKVVPIHHVMRFHGYSDHSCSEAMIMSAVHAYCAGIVEFHLDLDGYGYEFGKGHCWKPLEAKAMIENVNNWTDPEVEERLWRRCDEDGLRPMPELRYREWEP